MNPATYNWKALPPKLWRVGTGMIGLRTPQPPRRPGVLRVGIDATPLLGQRSGVGRYVERVMTHVAALEGAPDQVLTLFSIPQPIPSPLPAHTAPARRAFPARLLRPLWARWQAPPVEFLTGRLDVFHGGNYTMPPVRQAATVVTIHDLTFLRFPDTMTPGALAVLADLPKRVHSYDAVLTVSHAVAAEIESELGVPADRIVVAPNGVDSDWRDATAICAERRKALSVPERWFMFLGTLEPRKNLPMLLDAYTQARAQRPDLPDLVLVGGRGWGPEVNAGRGIRAVGYVSDEDLKGLLAGAQALCSPSLYEGFGLPVLEGLATGRPVLASDIPAHREVAGSQAELIDPHDRDAWAAALVKAADAPADDGRAGQRRAQADRYTWYDSARIHLDLYRRLGRT